jgi:hypothetical protein
MTEEPLAEEPIEYADSNEDAPSDDDIFDEPDEADQGPDDPTQELLTALGRFRRQVARAREGQPTQEWSDECMRQLISAVEAALQQEWKEVVHALTDTARVLQSYENAGRSNDAIPFLDEAYDILCFMVGDLIVGKIRPGVLDKWRQRYQKALSDMEAQGVALVEDGVDAEEDAFSSAAPVADAIEPSIEEPSSGELAAPEMPDEEEEAAHAEAAQTEEYAPQVEDQAALEEEAEPEEDLILDQEPDDVLVEEPGVEPEPLLDEPEPDEYGSAAAEPAPEPASDDSAPGDETEGPAAEEPEEEDEVLRALDSLLSELSEEDAEEAAEADETAEPVQQTVAHEEVPEIPEYPAEEIAESDASEPAEVQAFAAEQAAPEPEPEEAPGPELAPPAPEPEPVAAASGEVDVGELLEEFSTRLYDDDLELPERVREAQQVLGRLRRKAMQDDREGGVLMCLSMNRLLRLLSQGGAEPDEAMRDLTTSFQELFPEAESGDDPEVEAWLNTCDDLSAEWTLSRRSAREQQAGQPEPGAAPAEAQPEGSGTDLLLVAQKAVSEGNTASAKVFALQAAAKIAEMQGQEASDEVQNAEQTFTDLSARVEDARSEIRRAEEAVRQAEEEAYAASAQVDDAHGAQNQLSDQLEANAEEVARLEEEIRQLQAQRDEAAARREASEQRLEEARQSLSELEQTSQERKAAETEAREALEAARQNVTALEHRKNEQAAATEEARERLKHQEHSLKELRRMIAALGGSEDGESEEQDELPFGEGH